MREPAEHIAKGHRSLESGAYLLAGEFIEQAGREGYMAAFHAAMAFIVFTTGKEPKTHKGTHIEFARVCRDTGAIPPHFVSFLGNAYELKDIADYDGRRYVSKEEARTALATSRQLLEFVQALMAAERPSAER